MPLSTPQRHRQALHRRTIECRGYQREDCLWDIEAHLVDTKGYPFQTLSRGEVPPDEAVHDMWLRVTVDDDLLIHAVEAVIDASPFDICPNAVSKMQTLKGLRMTTGWNRQIKERLGGVKGCTHLTELLNPLATTAFQTIYPATRARRAQQEIINPEQKPKIIDTCHVFATDSLVIKRYWPRFYTGK